MKKLSLKDLHVKSFVTDLEDKDQKDVLGGQGPSLLCPVTLPLDRCITNYQMSNCNTCGIACTSPQNCTYQ